LKPATEKSRPPAEKGGKAKTACHARHAFNGLRSCRTKHGPARATAPAPSAGLRHQPGETRFMALCIFAAALSLWSGNSAVIPPQIRQIASLKPSHFQQKFRLQNRQ
jgi:hypothetical protein